jgi:basic amino acid/polyamine antiporter, APA family
MNANNRLVRGLTLIGAISIVIGTVIGTGVFLKARIMTCNVDTPLMVISVWCAAGLLSLAGALTYAELASMMPEAGGEYVFIREAYGQRWGFLYGWTQFSIVYSGSQAAKGVAFAVFLNVLTGGALNFNYLTLNIGSLQLPFGGLQIVALAIVTVMTIINCAAVSVSGKIASFLTGLKIALVIGVGLGAFLLAHGNWANFSLSNMGGTCEGVSASARGGLFGFGAAMLGALWAYDGWSNLTIVAGEIKNPQRNIPIALIGGMILMIILYLFINAAYFYVLTPTEVASVPQASAIATEVVKKFIGPLGVGLMAAGLMLSVLGSLFSGILTGARIPYAMAQDGLFFSSLGKVSQKTHVPVNALLVQGMWICVLTLTGSFDTLTDYAMFAAWIFYGLASASIFVFRKRIPNLERPYRTWGYPVIPVIFIAVTILLILNTIWTAQLRSLIGLGCILIGLPLYYYWKQKADAVRNEK